MNEQATAARFVAEADSRQLLAASLTVCGTCQQCVHRCGVFPGLLDMLDILGTADAGMMAPAAQDELRALCNLCGECVPACPHEAVVPDRFLAVAVSTHHRSPGARLMRRLSGQRRSSRPCLGNDFTEADGTLIGSCGSQLLIAGDLEGFRRIAGETVQRLARILERADGPPPIADTYCAGIIARYSGLLRVVPAAGTQPSDGEIAIVTEWVQGVVR